MAASDYMMAARSAADGPRSLIHVVDKEGEFCSTAEGITSFLDVHGLLDRGTDYTVVGIMGAQSSGKSTLLNILFGTCFEELNSQAGRQMTTKGVWFGSSPKVNNVLVMDLEGTDSVTRGQERHPFERQSALLALSVAEVLIINMWQHDIGRYVASNYGVLSTIFEVNLQLLAEELRSSKSPPNRTLLLFTIRDHVESESPISVISKQLRADVERIWSEMKMPAGLSHLKLSTMFDVEFVALPHKRYESEQFNSQVDALRLRFTDPSNPGYIFGPERRLQKTVSVPATGLGHYVETIWSTIKSHADLNLPSQKEMLAIFRCDELFTQISDEFESALEELRGLVENCYQEDFRKCATAILSSSVTAFDDAATGYHAGTVARKRGELQARLVEHLKPLWALQLGHAKALALAEFKTKADSALPKQKASDRFGEIISDCRRAAKQRLEELAAKSAIDSASGWSCDSFVSQLQADIDDCVEQLKQLQSTRLADEVRGKVRRHLLPQCDRIFELAPETMWDDVRDAYEQWLSELQGGTLDRKLSSLSLDASRAEKFRSDAAADALLQLHEEAAKHAAFVKHKMIRLFDQRFRLDASGLPRVWHQERDIRKFYIAARDHALSLLSLFSKFQLGRDSDKSPKKGGMLPTLISESEQAALRADFQRSCEDALNAAEASRARALQMTSTPAWVLPLILVLGWNEAMTILQHPLLLFLIILVGAGLGVIWYLDMWGPAMAMGKIVVRQVTSAVMAHLDGQPGRPTPDGIELSSTARRASPRKPDRSPRRSKSPLASSSPLGARVAAAHGPK